VYLVITNIFIFQSLFISGLKQSWSMKRHHTACWIMSTLSSCMQWFMNHVTMVLSWSMFQTEALTNSYFETRLEWSVFLCLPIN